MFRARQADSEHDFVNLKTGRRYIWVQVTKLSGCVNLLVLCDSGPQVMVGPLCSHLVVCDSICWFLHLLKILYEEEKDMLNKGYHYFAIFAAFLFIQIRAKS